MCMYIYIYIIYTYTYNVFCIVRMSGDVPNNEIHIQFQWQKTRLSRLSDCKESKQTRDTRRRKAAELMLRKLEKSASHTTAYAILSAAKKFWGPSAQLWALATARISRITRSCSCLYLK